jgi:hypothetical protein
MANYISYSNENYIKSQNIKVFPCAHRGYYVAGDSTATPAVPASALVFDPEARATTEANFTNTFHKLSNNKESYVISWNPGITNAKDSVLVCVIGGYYFEIYGQDDNEDWFDNNLNPKYLCIKLKEENLVSSLTIDGSTIDSDRKTTVLDSFADTVDYLDVKATNTDYVFTGLVVRAHDNIAGCSATLAPFIPDITYTLDAALKASFTEDTFNAWKRLENSDFNDRYFKNSAGSWEIFNRDTTTYNSVNWANDLTKVEIAVRSVAIKVNPAKLPITDLLDTGTGKYSVKMLADLATTADGNTYRNSTVASGDYSVALGRHTEASEVGSTALGDYTVASGEGSFAVGHGISTKATTASAKGSIAGGNSTTSSGEGSVAFGNNTLASQKGAVALGTDTTTSAENQVVIGKYNTDDAEAAFIIGNGEDGANKNVFTVAKTGALAAEGSLSIKGDITAYGATNNDLILGSDVEGSYGSIKVFGASQSDTAIFQVENTGDTTTKGTVIIDNTTTSTNVSTGALTVKGGVGINENLHVKKNIKTATGNLEVTTGTTSLGGSLTVSGVTTLNNNLTVADSKTATLGGNTTVKGTLTVANSKTATLGGDTEIKGTLTVTGITNLNNNLTVATDKTTKLNGTLEVSKAATLNDTLTVSGATTLNNTLTVASDKATTLGGTVAISKDTDYSSTATAHVAALTIAGGAYIAKKLHIGSDASLTGKMSIADTTDYNITDNSAALMVAGGAYIANKLYVGGDTTFRDNLEVGETLVRIKNETDSSTANNGALVVNGGVGIAKNLTVGKSIKATENLTLAGTSGTTNILQLGNESTSNKGGELIIYGSGTSEVFSVENSGKTSIAGDLTVGGAVSSAKALTVDGAITISSSKGIEGLSSLDVSGQIDATVFNAKSDARLKSNIEDYKFTKSILDLPIKRFEYIKDDAHTKYIGCLAQDLQKICPEFVNENADGILSIQESKLIYALLQEVKELKEKVEQLERR